MIKKIIKPISICVCACVRVCVCEKERDLEKKKGVADSIVNTLVAFWQEHIGGFKGMYSNLKF